MLDAMTLDQLYHISVSYDMPEEARNNAREVLRKKYVRCKPQDRFDLIIQTEGQCLQVLSDLKMDDAVIKLLCKLSMDSLLLIQNLTRFKAAPAELIRHVAKQKMVLDIPELERLIREHPNTPRDVQRKLKKKKKNNGA
jgi:hypothetical protein